MKKFDEGQVSSWGCGSGICLNSHYALLSSERVFFFVAISSMTTSKCIQPETRGQCGADVKLFSC